MDAGPDHLQERVLGEVVVTGIIEGLGKGPGRAEVLVGRAEGKPSGVDGRRRMSPG